jgi:hypothetical protein
MITKKELSARIRSLERKYEALQFEKSFPGGKFGWAEFDDFCQSYEYSYMGNIFHVSGVSFDEVSQVSEVNNKDDQIFIILRGKQNAEIQRAYLIQKGSRTANDITKLIKFGDFEGFICQSEKKN